MNITLQKAILAKLDAEEREEDRQKEAEKKKYAEQRRKEDLAREREERIRAREDERKVKETAKEGIYYDGYCFRMSTQYIAPMQS